MSRRGALARLAGFLAGSTVLRGQQDPSPLSAHRRAPGLAEMRDVWDVEAVFAANLPRKLFDYTARGDGTEWTMRRNREAFDWVDVVPGRACAPGHVDLATQIYGTKMQYPIMLAPTARHWGLHPDGEAGTHRGASAAAQTPYIVANEPNVPLPEVAAAGGGPLWYQMYGTEDPEANRPMLELAQASGCRAVVITVDQQASAYPRSLQDKNLRGEPLPTSEIGAAARKIDAVAAARLTRYGMDLSRLWYTWEWLEQVRKHVQVPILVKGILTGEDAQICVGRGLGVIVSNHGGRSLDYGPTALEVLPEIVEVVRGRVPVLIDSGFRRGSDVFKALALGADAVCIGRVARWGLGAFGAPGVQRVLEILQEELVQTAAAAGCASLASIKRNAVKTHFT